MRKLQSALIFVALLCLSVSFGCNGGGGSSNGGFRIRTQLDYGNGFVLDSGGIVSGNHVQDRSGATGTVYSFGVNTSPSGRASVDGGRAPALWRLTGNVAGLCFFSNIDRDIDRGEEERIICPAGFLITGYSASPNSIDVYSPPATMTITGSGMDGTHGLPSVAYYDESGYLVAETTTTTVAGDGTWLQANTPNLSSVYTGNYTVIVRNAMADGNWRAVGAANVYVYGNDPPPPPDPEPDPCDCPPGEPCTPCYNQ